MTGLGTVWGKNEYYILPPLASLNLFAAEYLRETNISTFTYYLLTVTCFLDALKKSSKRKERKKSRSYNKLQCTAERRQGSKRSG